MNTAIPNSPGLRPGAAPVATNALGFPMSGALPGDGGGPAARQSTFGLADIWRILSKYRWLILASLILGIFAAIAIVLVTTPQYRSTATLEISLEQVKMVDVGGTASATPMTDVQSLETNYGLLRSAALAERVAQSLNLAQSADFADQSAPPQTRLNQATSQLMQNFTVTPIPSSRLVQISYKSPSAEMAARIPNAYASNFIESVLERRYGASEYARNFLERRIAEVRKRLEDAERRLTAYAQEQGIVLIKDQGADASSTSEASGSLEGQRLISANNELSQARNARAAAEQRYRQATSGSPMSEVLSNGPVQGLRNQLNGLRAEYATKANTLSAEHPEMVDLQTKIAAVERSLRNETGQVIGTLQSDYRAALARENEMAKQVSALRGSVLDLRGRSIQYNILQRDVDTDRSLYAALLKRYSEVGVAGGVGENTISVVDAAKQPGAPFEPEPVRSTVIGALIGLLAGLGTAFALEFLTYAIRSQEDLETKLELTPLGTIPKSEKGANLTEALENPRSPMMEAYASLRSAIQFATAQGAPSTLLITSSGPAEGKSTTALALARNFARLGYGTLLLDADLRNPSFTTDEGNAAGLSMVLTGASTIDEALRATSVAGLSLMEAGRVPPNPADLLADPALAEILRKLSGMFDIIILDGPPVLDLADAPLLSSICDGTLVVFEAGKVKLSVAQNTVSRLRTAGARLIGGVLTKFDAKTSGYGYGYGHGYGYGNVGKEAGSGTKYVLPSVGKSADAPAREAAE